MLELRKLLEGGPLLRQKSWGDASFGDKTRILLESRPLRVGRSHLLCGWRGQSATRVSRDPVETLGRGRGCLRVVSVLTGDKPGPRTED